MFLSTWPAHLPIVFDGADPGVAASVGIDGNGVGDADADAADDSAIIYYKCHTDVVWQYETRGLCTLWRPKGTGSKGTRSNQVTANRRQGSRDKSWSRRDRSKERSGVRVHGLWMLTVEEGARN